MREEFLDSDSALIEPASDQFLDVEVADPLVLTWESDRAGAFRGRFRGVAAGETTAVFRFMHGAAGDAHADFESAPVQLMVP